MLVISSSFSSPSTSRSIWKPQQSTLLHFDLYSIRAIPNNNPIVLDIQNVQKTSDNISINLVAIIILWL
jgi:hypothetical protein